MSELYDSVRSPQKREKRRSPALIAAVLACLLLLGFAVGFAAHSVVAQRRFWNYVSDLSDSFYYGRTHHCLTAQAAGDTRFVNGDTGTKLFNKITLAGRGKERGNPPEGERILLDFGDGSTLTLWYTALSGGNTMRNHGVCLLYESASGSRYLYDTDKLTYEDFLLYVNPAALGLE